MYRHFQVLNCTQHILMIASTPLELETHAGPDLLAGSLLAQSNSNSNKNMVHSTSARLYKWPLYLKSFRDDIGHAPKTVWLTCQDKTIQRAAGIVVILGISTKKCACSTDSGWCKLARLVIEQVVLWASRELQRVTEGQLLPPGTPAGEANALLICNIWQILLWSMQCGMQQGCLDTEQVCDSLALLHHTLQSTASASCYHRQQALAIPTEPDEGTRAGCSSQGPNALTVGLQARCAAVQRST